MRILLVTPARRSALHGNRVTALRWTRQLRRLGHHVRIADAYEDGDWGLLIALHAQKSAQAVAEFKKRRPGEPVIVALTGTDLYESERFESAEAKASRAAADRLVVLQPRVLELLPADERSKARVIHQSAQAPRPRAAPPSDHFRICELAHLRSLKDPLLGAEAVRLLPTTSRLELVHWGQALSEDLAVQAKRESAENPRYRWMGATRHASAMKQLSESHALVVSSRLEGGANVVTEAIACGLPVLSTRIEGSLGILGEDYPGYFPIGDAPALARLLGRAEEDGAFYAELRARIAALAPLAYPARERRAWRSLLAELAPSWHSRLSMEEQPIASRFARDVTDGLSSRPKRLSCSYFYDDNGSSLFDAITDLPEYYPTRVERGIIAQTAAGIARAFPAQTALVELGSGSAEKTRILVDAFLRSHGKARYVAIDISAAALTESAEGLLPHRPTLSMRALRATYETALPKLASFSPKLVLWLGSNIGNLDRDRAAAFLADVGRSLGPSDGFLVGIDLRKSKAVLDLAYDDPDGVTAAFNKNLMARINHDLGADFDLALFRHRAGYDETLGRVDMHLVSERPQRVSIPKLGMTVDFAAGEAIHTECSYKYSPEEIDALARASGLSLAERWFDRERRFCLCLLRAAGTKA